jgi:hypothetical protein
MGNQEYHDHLVERDKLERRTREELELHRIKRLKRERLIAQLSLVLAVVLFVAAVGVSFGWW